MRKIRFRQVILFLYIFLLGNHVFVLLSIFLGMVVSDHPEPESIHRDKYHHYNQLMANNFQTWDTGPNFDTKLSQNVTAIHWKTTKIRLSGLQSRKQNGKNWLQINAKGKRI